MMPSDVERVLKRIVYFAFLTLLATTSLAITTLLDVVELKWFIVRTGGCVLAVAWIGMWAFGKSIQFRWSFISLGVALLLTVKSLSLIHALNPWLSLEALMNVVGLAATYYVAANVVTSTRDTLGAMWAVTLCGLVSAIYGISQHYGYDFFPWIERYDMPVSQGVSFFGHATFAASYLILAIPLSLGLVAATHGTLQRGLAIVSCAAMVYHLSFSGGRGAALSLTATGLLIAFVVFMKRRREPTISKKGGVFVGSLSMIPVFLAIVAAGSILMVQAWSVKESDLLAIKQNAGLQRLALWDSAVTLFVNHPVGGVGLGNFELAAPATWSRFEQEQFVRTNTMGFQVHNEYLEVAAEEGILGISVFAFFLILALYEAYGLYAKASTRTERSIALAFLGVLLAAIFDALFIFNFQVPGSAIIFWTVLGLITSRRRQFQQDQELLPEHCTI